MLAGGPEEHPDCTVVVKVHPDVILGRARGHFRPEDLAASPRASLRDGRHPAALLERAEAVYVVTSQMGFEALLWGRPVHCFRHALLCRLGADAGPAGAAGTRARLGRGWRRWCTPL